MHLWNSIHLFHSERCQKTLETLKNEKSIPSRRLCYQIKLEDYRDKNVTNHLWIAAHKSNNTLHYIFRSQVIFMYHK